MSQRENSLSRGVPVQEPGPRSNFGRTALKSTALPLRQNDDELLVRAFAVLKSQGCRKLVPWETQKCRTLFGKQVHGTERYFAALLPNLHLSSGVIGGVSLAMNHMPATATEVSFTADLRNGPMALWTDLPSADGIRYAIHTAKGNNLHLGKVLNGAYVAEGAYLFSSPKSDFVSYYREFISFLEIGGGDFCRLERGA